jgi:putative transposase
MGRLNKLTADNSDIEQNPIRPSRLIGELNDHERSMLETRLACVSIVENEFDGVCSQAAYTAITERLEGQAPSYSAVQKWNRKWLASNQDPNALIVKSRQCEVRSKQMDERALACLHQSIESFYLALERPTVQALYAVVVAEIFDKSAALPEWDRIRIPSRSSVYRAVQNLDPYLTTLKRYGKRAADMRFRNVQAGFKASYPLEKVQIDHTTLDVLLVYGDTLRRPYLTVAIDVFSRMVIGYYLSFDAPSYNSVMHCLMHSILPKSEVSSSINNIKHTWPCSGRPITLLLDNAAELHAKPLISATMQMHIEVQYCPLKEPQYKGIVERFFGTLNTKFLHMIPGTTRSNIQQKGDYAAHQFAGLSIDKLDHWLLKFLIDDYSQSYHSGLSSKPVDAWTHGTQKRPTRPYTGSLPLVALLGAIGKRVVRRDGINFMNLTYASRELSDALAKWSMGKPQTAKLVAQFKYDPRDISSIWVFIFEGDSPINVPCIETQYTSGLSLAQHKQCRKVITAEHGNKGEFRDVELARTRRDIALGVTKDAELGRKERKKSKRKGRTPKPTPDEGNKQQLPPIYTPIDQIQQPFASSEAEAAADHAKSWFSSEN